MSLTYLEWNDLLIKKYFNDEMAGKEVIIFADREVIDSIGSEFNERYDDFCRAVKAGPPWAFQNGICQKAIASAKKWRVKKIQYPPYFAFLVLFVTAATIESEFDPKAFYPLLRRILGYDEERQFPSFDKMDLLWADLQKWSIEDKHESLGRFTLRIHGGKIHVGIPFSQAIFSENERKLLPYFFWQEGFDPVDPPSEIVLLNKLAIWGKKHFTRRTMALLESKDASHLGFQSLIAELVTSDLHEWDGSYFSEWDSTTKKTDEPRKKMALAGARICLKPEFFGGTVQSYLRIKASRPFPDGGLVFDFNGITLTCQGMGAEGWSTQMESENGGTSQIFRPLTLDWKRNYSFLDSEDAWTSRLKGSLIRVFLPGITEGLPDWVEVQRVIPGSKYLICCHKSISENVFSWGREWNNSFNKHSLVGLPPDWILFTAEGIRKSFPGSDALTLPRTSMFHINGGIRIGRGNQYLSISPPSIIIDKSPDAGPLMLNKQPLTLADYQNIFPLSEELPRDIPLVIELQKNDGTIIQRRTIYFVLPEYPVQSSKRIVRNKFGIPIGNFEEIPDGTSPGVSGVLAPGDISEIGTLNFIPTYLSHRIIFIGKIAGQIADWPDEDLSIDWQPVWAIGKISRDRWQVYFSDTSGEKDLRCLKSNNRTSTRDIKQWKNIVYRMRGQVIPPIFNRHRTLWKEYVRFAKNV
ncbi:MAG: hypothetical protein WC626_10880 [Methanoregula sp.]